MKEAQVFFRPDDVRGYRCYEKTCVAGSNYKIIEDADYRVCAEACNEEEKCLGFEIYHNWGGRKTKFKQGDCILNSANRQKKCRAYNLNWCVKHDLILAETVEYYDFADGLCPSESHLTHEECQRVANEKAIDGGWDEYYDFEAINKADKLHGCHKSENDETYGEGAPSFTIFYNSNKGLSKRKDTWKVKPICKFVKSEFTCEGEQPGCENCLYHHQRTGNDQCRICNGGYILNDNHKCEKVDIMDHCPSTYTASRWTNWICRNWNKKPTDCIIHKGGLGEPIQQTTSYRGYCKPEFGDDEAAIGSLVGKIENYLPSFNFFILLVFCVIAGYGIAIYRSRKEENNYQILTGDNKRIELVEAQE